MRRILVDTNIVIDLLARREEFFDEAAQLFSLADRKEIELFISSLTFANTHYILSRYSSRSEAREILRKFKVLVTIISLDDKIIELALSDSHFPDLEDGLQYYSAIENQIEIIVTRNKKDFKRSKIPVLTAREFLLMNPVD
jgi:predicted nucleic acid-binding protein